MSEGRSDKTRRFVNPKHNAFMQACVARVQDGTFDELEIRFLLLGMREFAQRLATEVPRLPRGDVPEVLWRYMPLLFDLASTVAHPEYKDQGALLDYVKSTDSQMAKSWAKMKRGQKVLMVDSQRKAVDLAMPPAVQVLSADLLTQAFIQLIPEVCVPSVAVDERIIGRFSDIQLCLLTILHYTQMPSLDEGAVLPVGIEPRGAYLALHAWGGVYGLYAGVINSHSERVLGSNRAGSYFQRFAVLVGSVPVGDGPQLDAANPSVLFALRDPDGKLRLDLGSEQPR